jgi:hypothetical protein
MVRLHGECTVDQLVEAFLFLFLVLCRNLTAPTILAGFDFLPDRSPAAVVAVEMWEPAFCAGFQAPGKGRPSGWELPRFPPGRVISIAKPEDSAHFRQNLPSTTVRHRKSLFLETRVNCVLLQILVQSPFLKLFLPELSLNHEQSCGRKMVWFP